LANLNQINWKLFFAAGGVFGIVRDNSGPVPIPVDQMASFEKLGLATEPVYEIPLSAYKPNTRVEVIGGPLCGALGNFIGKSKKTGQFIVCLDLFKRALVTELEADLIKPY
jgi:transcription antitermination factor NusG